MKRTLLLSVFMLGICSSMFASWPPASDYTVYEWRVSTEENPFAISFNQIVFFEDGFYQCTAEDGTFAYSEKWNPKEWEAPNYTKVADGRLWEVGMEPIQYLEYVLYGNGVYQCTAEDGTFAYSEKWNPEEWEAPNYQKICNADLAPKTNPGDQNILPDNYVGYWYDNELAWLVGWITINWELHTVHKCIAKTHSNGGETPGGQGTTWGYWTSSLGEEKDLLSIEGVTIPTWDDERSWPKGAIVELDGKYYTCLADTHKDGAEIPGATGSDWGYWTDLELYGSNVKMLFADQFSYAVQNGYLVVNSQAPVSIQLYSPTGQIIAKTTGKSIELPGKGAYIAKINTGGKITTVKVLK